MALDILLKSVFYLLTTFGLLSTTLFAQTSRIISLPKQYTLDLASLNKKSFKKERLGSEARKLAKIDYLDSLKAAKEKLKEVKLKLDSLTRSVINAKHNPFNELAGQSEIIKFKALDSLDLTKQSNMLVALAKGKTFEEYFKKADKDTYKSWLEYKKVKGKLDPVIGNKDSLALQKLLITEGKGQLPETELNKFNQLKSEYNKNTVLVDSLREYKSEYTVGLDSISQPQDSVNYTQPQLDSLSKQQRIDSLNSLFNRKKEAYIELAKSSKYLQTKTYESKLMERDELKGLSEQQQIFATLEKDLAVQKKKIESVRNFDELDPSLLSEHKELLNQAWV